ncbi:MAG: proton-conducting membrane transporter [Spirochaetaceae bacterium]|nr:MAG: proton-conducting membrane transporter [Spirochaetaceae bacterium]
MIPLYALVILPVLAATAGYFLPRSIYKHVLILVQLVHLLMVVLVFIEVRTGGVIRHYVGGWSDGIGIALVADTLSITMVLLASLLFLLLFLFNYGKRYMDNIFQFLFILLQGVSIGVFLAGDLFHVYVLIELTTITISILIMYKRDKQALYDGLLYILLNLFGVTFFLLGVGFIYKTFGVLDMALIAERIQLLDDTRGLALPYALLLSAIGLKAAILPLFSWLPSAHGALTAPSAVSAVLSGLQVKVGIFLFLRVQWVFSGVFETTGFFFVVALLTAVAGFTIALVHHDVKLILAFSTVSQIGLIMMGLNAGTEVAYFGSVFHIINHALFKALLFITAGVITHAVGTRDITRIRNIAPKAPLFAVATLLAMLGITGGPFFNGSVSKYLIQAGLAGQPGEVLIYIVNLGTIMVFVKYAQMYLPRRNPAASQQAADEGVGDVVVETEPHGAEQPIPGRAFAMKAVALLIGAVCLAAGVLAAPLMRLLFDHDLPVSGAFYLEKTLIYVVTLAIGIALYYGVVHRSRFLVAVREYRFTFNTICLLYTGFFASLLCYTYIFA